MPPSLEPSTTSVGSFYTPDRVLSHDTSSSGVIRARESAVEAGQGGLVGGGAQKTSADLV